MFVVLSLAHGPGSPSSCRGGSRGEVTARRELRRVACCGRRLGVHRIAASGEMATKGDE